MNRFLFHAAGLWLIAFLALHAMVATGADTIVTRPTALRADRYVDAASVRQIDAGTHVELLKTEAGWVQIRIDGVTGWVRATSMAGDAAAVAPLARLETGRSGSGNIVVAAGIRRIPKASRHALIIGVASADFTVPAQHWDGVDDDVQSARIIAQRIAIPDDNIEIVQGSHATLSGVADAIDRLGQRVQPGDQVLVYFSGPGTFATDGSPRGDCVAAWVTSDGMPLSASALVKRLQPVFANADKVTVISDAAYAATTSPAPATGPLRKAVTMPAAGRCVPPAGSTDMALVTAAVAAGTSAMNVVHIQAVGPDQGVDQPHAGGIFSQALVDCFLGDATDTDKSTSISVAELADCANRHGRTGADRPGNRTPLASVTGNSGFSPIVGLVTAGVAPIAPPDAPGPVAGIDGTAAPLSAIEGVLAQRDGRIRVELSAMPSTLQIGHDFLDLKLTSTHDGFVYLILLGSDEKSFYLLFPNELDRDNRIAASETLRLPRPNWRVQSQGPAGRDIVLAVVAESERDLTSFEGRRAGPFSTMLTDVQGRAQLQWLLGRSGLAETPSCVTAGKQRNLAAIRVCSDAFGAARVDVMER